MNNSTGIDIQARGFNLTEGLRQHAERRLQLALSWSGDDVGAVTLLFSLSEDPCGNSDNRCCILVHFPGAPDEVIEDTELDLYLALDRAIDRTARRLAPRLKRLHHHAPFSGEERGTEYAAPDAVLTAHS